MELLRILADQKEELMTLDISSLISRPEEKDIDINSKFAQVVIGVRRCGKSTLCQKALIESKVNFGYVNFDDERLTKLTSLEFDDVLSALYQLNGEFNHLFLDEIQNIKNWPLVVNRMLRRGMHLVLTGSNANLLSSDLVTHLTGRYKEIELFPFSFAEYCRAKRVDISGLSTKSQALLKRGLNEYLFEGGFPEIVDGTAPRHYARHLLATIVQKDIVVRYRIRYPEIIWKLCNTLLDNICCNISASALADKFGVKSFHTVERYLSFLQNAYLLVSLKKYSNKAIERKLAMKGYAIDMGFVSDHEDRFQTEGLGWRLENVVAIELLRRARNTEEEIYFGEEARKYNIDFIVAINGRIKELIQVTYDFTNPSVKLYNREIGNLKKAAKLTGCKHLTLIIMEGDERKLQEDGLTINIQNATRWLLNP